jgi:hypothetical protein
VLAGCGSDKGADEVVTDPDPTPTATAVAVPTTPPALPGAPKTPKPGKSAKPPKTPTATATNGPKPRATPAKTMLYPVAMPDGRTAPVAADFSFTNLKLDQRFLMGTITTVDVTYKGPGSSGVTFIAAITYTTKQGQKGSVQGSGTVSRLKSGFTQSVRLGGASDIPRIDESKGYEAKYTVTSVSDDDKGPGTATPLATPKPSVADGATFWRMRSKIIS